jgi:hypothetical protein
MAMDDVISVIKGEAVHEVSATCVTQVGLVESMGATGAAWPEAQADPAKMARLVLRSSISQGSRGGSERTLSIVPCRYASLFYVIKNLPDHKK